MAVSANTATFTWNADVVGGLVSIGDFTAERATIDISTMGSTEYREFVPGKKNSTFTVSVYLDHSAHMAAGEILADYAGGDVRTFSLDFADGKVSGSAFITSFGLSAEQDGASTCTISCQVVSALVFAETP
jgi:predicted secreted protein